MVRVHSIWIGKFSFRLFLFAKENFPIENASIFCSTTYSVESKTSLSIRAIARTSCLSQSYANFNFWYIMRRNFIVWELVLCQVHKDSIFPLVKFEREDNLLQSPSHHLKIFEVSLNEMHCSGSLWVHRCRGDDWPAADMLSASFSSHAKKPRKIQRNVRSIFIHVSRVVDLETNVE